MIISELKNDKTQFHAKVNVTNDEISQQIDLELKNIAKTAKMDGFRVGKVPASILRKKYTTNIRSNIARDKIEDAIRKIVKDNKLNVAFDPEVEDYQNNEGADLEFVLKFELLPNIMLPDFKKITIEKPVLDVTEKDINEQLNRLAGLSMKYEKETKAKAKSGDQVTIDAVGYVGGVAFDGGKLDAHKLVLGSKSFIPGFEDQLIGAKAGDDVVVQVAFPDDYHAKELAGKPSEFKVKVLSVHQSSPVKIDDELAKNFKCENVDQLKEMITKNISANYDEPINIFMKMNLFDKLEKILDFKVPPSLLTNEKNSLKRQESQLDDEEEMKDVTDNQKGDYLDNLATRRVRIGLMLAEYVKQKSINVTEEDIRSAVIAQARSFPNQEKMVYDYFTSNKGALESLKGPILESKGVAAIFANEIIVNEKRYTQEKLEKLLQTELKD